MATRQQGSQDTLPTTRHGGRAWFVAAAAVLLLGLLASALWSGYGVLQAWRAPEDFARTSLPGTVSVRVTDTGTQWLYYEHPDRATPPSLRELRVRVTAPAGAAVAPEPTHVTLHYDLSDGGLGTAVGTFAAAVPGTYAVTVAGDTDPDAALAVGPDVADPLWTPLLGAAAVLGLCFMVAVGLALAGLGRGRQAATRRPA